jgi:hypothetical protein
MQMRKSFESIIEVPRRLRVPLGFTLLAQSFQLTENWEGK